MLCDWRKLRLLGGCCRSVWAVQLVVALSLATLQCAAIAQSEELSQAGLRATYDALFDSFLPVRELPANAPEAAMFAQVRESLWTAAGSSPQFQSLLKPFIDLRSLGGTCGISGFLQTAGNSSFSALDPLQRQRLLSLLQTCSENEPRRLAMSLRNFYVDRSYGALQETLSGVHLDRYASAEYIGQHQPKLPATRLRYDATKKEIFAKDREIDYLIVGSGPAGSVLAHELRRGGKTVVLVERGSFLVPGAMMTRSVNSLVDTRTSSDGGIVITNGMTVGGGTQVNVDLCFAPTRPSVQTKIESWRREGRIGANDFTFNQIASAYEWVKAAIGTRVLSEDEINANNRVLWDGARLAGLHPKLYDLNAYPPGKSPYPVTDKRSSESQLLIDALEDKENPLSLIPDADVQRVLFEGKQGTGNAIGVVIKMRVPIAGPAVIADPNGLGIAAGETVTIRARKVILSAGALGSPTILLRSGVVNDQIGRGVVLHVSMPIIGKFDHTIDALSGTQASVYVDDALLSEGTRWSRCLPNRCTLRSCLPARPSMRWRW